MGVGQNHTFTLADISGAYRACQIKEPASISNTILDLTRQDRGIESRLPTSIVALGHDLRKKTGSNYAGEFVFVGVGNALRSWHLWSDVADTEFTIENKVPPKIENLLHKDEGALFSVIDYCDVLSIVLYGKPGSVTRVQNPVKWQPNEIDGLYFSNEGGIETLIPIEAKALTTGDAINLEQMQGAYDTILAKRPGYKIMPLGIQMIRNGMNIGVFTMENGVLEIERYLKVQFDPPITSWQ